MFGAKLQHLREACLRKPLKRQTSLPEKRQIFERWRAFACNFLIATSLNAESTFLSYIMSVLLFLSKKSVSFKTTYSALLSLFNHLHTIFLSRFYSFQTQTFALAIKASPLTYISNQAKNDCRRLTLFIPFLVTNNQIISQEIIYKTKNKRYTLFVRNRLRKFF
jgi:hypothetical protein